MGKTKYIDADKVIDYANQEVSTPFFSIEREGAEDVVTYKNKWAFVKQVMIGMPAADVAKVVRCCKCIYWDRDTIRHQINDFRDWNEAECLVLAERDGYNEINRYTEADDFCSRGERKDG